MVQRRTMTRARRWRALFAARAFTSALTCALLLAAAPLQASPLTQSARLPGSCQTQQQFDARATVAHVYDGDTVRLRDGTRVRLIGLDTPEFHYRDPDRGAEPFATEAGDALARLLSAHDHEVGLVYDRERQDRYRRTLAHLFTPDGESITARLLVQGLATGLTIPPNDWNVDCYRDAEREAALRRLNIWSLPGNRLFRAGDLPRDAEGFRRVEGRVVRLGESPRATWINLEGNVALRIDHVDMHHFPDLEVRTLVDKRVRARGHVYNYRGQPRIRIRHPADLEMVER
ncbi:thermonuclease family protein [Thioalkalivibrio thiocyanodenitrificans]|uniref:thermonuclease family protein n=1 Tax=Thioalkalivibrio thiocyanodenitrificans TaxID=243063 RepID=UPI001E3AFD75|nr:thermonuclease family protein [Thioalkalivibrio thiocyanodenitrificans]